jgi:hypothetical protein
LIITNISTGESILSHRKLEISTSASFELGNRNKITNAHAVEIVAKKLVFQEDEQRLLADDNTSTGRAKSI